MTQDKKTAKDTPRTSAPQRSRYQVSVQRGKARSRVRYVETSEPVTGCKCL